MRPASLYSRVLAFFIDEIIVSAAVSAIAGVLLKFHYAGMAAYVLLLFLAPFLYFIGMEWFNKGQTIGKKLMGLCVCDQNCGRLAFSQIMVRNLFRALDMLPSMYLLGAVSAFLDGDGRRIGDMMAQTMVVSARKRAFPDIGRPALSDKNSMRGYPLLVQRLRNELPGWLPELLHESVERRDDMDDASRVALFAELVKVIREYASIPEDILSNIPNELIVKDVLDVLA